MYFDIYSVKLGAKVKVEIFDKNEFDNLRDCDLVLATKDYEIKNFSMGQDEFGYLVDDIKCSDSFDCEWNKSFDNIVTLSVFRVDEKKPIMRYSIISTFIDY